MKRFFSVVLFCLLAGVVFVLYVKTRSVSTPVSEGISSQKASSPNSETPSTNHSSEPSAGSSPSATSAANPSAQSSASAKPADVAARAGERPADANDEISLPPNIVLQNVRRAVHQYGDMFGGNPVGTNPEITAALTGKNPKQINFLNGQPGMRINENGELVDAWGTPYFFHQLSGTEMEIHSAGPDKIMWTSDDLVTK